MREAQIEALNTLRQDLHHLHTFPPLTEAIIHYLKSWMREVPPTFLAKITISFPLYRLLNQAILEQDKIGWDHFLRGRFSTLWTTIQ